MVYSIPKFCRGRWFLRVIWALLPLKHESLAESCQAEVCFSNDSITMVIKYFSPLNVLSYETPKHFAQVKCFSQYWNVGADYPSGGSSQNIGTEWESDLLMLVAKNEAESRAEDTAHRVWGKPDVVHLQLYCPLCISAEMILSFLPLSTIITLAVFLKLFLWCWLLKGKYNLHR